MKILPFLFQVRAGNCDSSKGVAYFLILFLFFLFYLSRTREVKQVFFISIVSQLSRSGMLVKKCHVFVKLQMLMLRRQLRLGVRRIRDFCVQVICRWLSRNFVNIKFACLDTAPIKPNNVENSLNIFVINLPYQTNLMQVWGDKSSFRIVPLRVTEKYLIYIIFFS